MIVMEQALRNIERDKDYPLIKKFGLIYTRHNQRFVCFEQPIKIRSQFPRINEQSKFWYRAMTRDQFLHLLKTDQVEVGHSYRGITDSKSYAQSYMTNDLVNTHLVEFRLYDINLYDEFTTDVKKKGLSDLNKVQFEKVEEGAVSFGLGPTGHYTGKAGTYFNNLINTRGVMWNLVGLHLRL